MYSTAKLVCAGVAADEAGDYAELAPQNRRRTDPAREGRHANCNDIEASQRQHDSERGNPRRHVLSKNTPRPILPCRQDASTSTRLKMRSPICWACQEDLPGIAAGSGCTYGAGTPRVRGILFEAKNDRNFGVVLPPPITSTRR